MKVVLNQDVKDIGKAGSVVNVAEGYARNFLFPRKLAAPADEGAMKNLEQKRKAIAVKNEKILAEAKQIAEQIENTKITINGKTGTGSKLYGSITSQEIADALSKQHKIVIDKRMIHITEPIKSLGTYEVPIKLHHEVSAKIHVEVVGQQ